MTKKHCPYCGHFIRQKEDWCSKCSERFTVQLLVGHMSNLSRQTVKPGSKVEMEAK